MSVSRRNRGGEWGRRTGEGRRVREEEGRGGGWGRRTGEGKRVGEEDW